MAETVCVAVAQFACSADREANVSKAEKVIRFAASRGAKIICIQELFESLYFCQVKDAAQLQEARTLEESETVRRMCALAKELAVVLPVPFFERCGQAFYNSCVVIDADGSSLGIYRKSHIPDSPGYNEKFYFSPGDTGFCVFRTRYAAIGIGICWDQWFPEAARAMCLGGAEILLYPTAIGSEPQDSTIDSRPHWQRCMQGHAAANLTPVMCSNRVGAETVGDSTIIFYGHSFIAGGTGEMLTEAGPANETVLTTTLDLGALRKQRNAWGVFRDRRVDLYAPLLTIDGHQMGGKGGMLLHPMPRAAGWMLPTV